MFRPYNRNVLIGNWVEDRVLEEDVIKDYIEKRSRGQLLSQQMAMQGQCQPQVRLTTVNDNKIHFGDSIQLKCDGTANQATPLIAKANRSDCYLGASSNGSCCGVVSPAVTSTTAFFLRSVDGSCEGSSIRYGQPFSISTQDGQWFLHSDTRSYDKAAHSSRLQHVDFAPIYNHECDWVATCLNPKFRLEADGAEIPANEKIVLLHMKTNKALGVVTNFTNSASFEIVANTFYNSHKAEEDVNHWRIVTNIPSMSAPPCR